MPGRDTWDLGIAGGYDADDDEPDVQPDADPDPPPPAAALTCRHCGSDRIAPRSSSADTEAVQFACAACGKRTTHHLPYGYRKIYRAITDQEDG